ncbi:MAG: methionine gamma-lyase family protein [Lachnospiraceae bacterium]|nr:methionine gamma-lyase family protein [Lachnospiraceae bacterium]
MNNIYNVDEKIYNFVDSLEKSIDFSAIENIYEYNQIKVLKNFIKNEISESHFNTTSGYGYNDIGRDKIEELYKDIFNVEDALVREQIVSGTHAISLSLYAILNPNDKILSINGLPYDTLHKTLGIDGYHNSLKKYNISFDYVDLINNDFDYDLIREKLNLKQNVVMIQRSRGYTEKYPLSISQIKNVISFIKKINKDTIVFVDNCYGEFVDILEPTDVGADIVCGSLIKNIGGGIAETGGYIVGKKNLIELCAERLSAPGLGKEVGVSFFQNKNILKGLYFAPQIVANSLKVAKLTAKVFNELKIDTVPRYNEDFNDIVLGIKFNNRDRLVDFCNIIQSTSPVDSYVKAIEAPMPGYDSNIIMAAGCFTSGSSIELSCDAPIRPPYMAFLQGGLTYYQGKYAIMKAIEIMSLL